MTEVDRNEKKAPAEKSPFSGAIGFGSSFAIGMAIFALGGHWLDKKTGRESLFTLLGVGLGLIYGVWEIWKLVTFSNRDDTRDDQPKNGEGDSYD